MSKPLELTIYPKWNGYYRELDGSPLANSLAADAYSIRKRLREAEIAAEFWAASVERTRDAANILGGQYDNPHAQKSFQRSIDKTVILHRFANLPHYDQETT